MLPPSTPLARDCSAASLRAVPCPPVSPHPESIAVAGEGHAPSANVHLALLLGKSVLPCLVPAASAAAIELSVSAQMRESPRSSWLGSSQGTLAFPLPSHTTLPRTRR